MNRETVTMPQKYGGLSIHRARETKVSLLGKIIW